MESLHFKIESKYIFKKGEQYVKRLDIILKYPTWPAASGYSLYQVCAVMRNKAITANSQLTFIFFLS